jgi:hypothetical protein
LFRESNETNNSTWVDIRLRGLGTKSATVTVLAYGPSAPKVG